MLKLLVFIFIINCSLIYGQTTNAIFFHVDKTDIKYKLKNDTISHQIYEKKALNKLNMLGYINLICFDTIRKNSNIHYYYTYSKHFKKVILKLNNKPSVTNFTSSYLSINKQLVDLENTGYPFASIKIINQNVKKNSLILNYKIDSGYFFSIDKIHIKSKDKFNKKTILNLIGIKIGEPYNEKKLQKISQLIKASGLYETIREPAILFKPKKAEIYIYISKKKSSSADGYVGLLQDKTTQKISLNGYINLHLKNTLNKAELINLNWKSNPDKTQKLKFNFAYPYILNTPIGVETDLNLHKQDTSFVKSLANFGINYQQPFYSFGIYNQVEQSSILTNVNLLNIRSFTKNTVGLKIILRPQFTNKLNSYTPILELKNGFFNYKSDSIKTITSTSNLRYMINLVQKIDFLNYFSFKNSTGLKGMTSSYNLSRNELIYFGGLKSVRGFYELELVGNTIVTVLNEIEYKPISILSFKLIYDYSSFKFNGNFHTNSFGFGFGLVNENSVLEIIIANGVINSNPLDFNNTKIHIGFSSSF